MTRSRPHARRDSLDSHAAVFSRCPRTLRAQSSSPWFGVPLPPGFEPHALQVIKERPARAGRRSRRRGPTGVSSTASRSGVTSSRSWTSRSRVARGGKSATACSGGRVSGPAVRKTAPSSGPRSSFIAAGLSNVELQRFDQDEGASIWVPLSWEVPPRGGPGLRGGYPRRRVWRAPCRSRPAICRPSGLTAPLVYVGTATPGRAGPDRHPRQGSPCRRRFPQGTYGLHPQPGRAPGHRDLLDRGAVAVLTIVDLPRETCALADIGCGGGNLLQHRWARWPVPRACASARPGTSSEVTRRHEAGIR